jgi:hypothetical protein
MLKRLLFFAVAVIIMIIVLNILSVGFITDYSPYGIISFELANTYKDAKAIMMAVGTKKLQIHTAFDFLFIIAYTSFFFFIIKQITEKLKLYGIKKLNFYFLELSILAGIFDLIENIAMLITLGGYGSDISVGVTKWAAIAKFTVIILVVVFIVLSSLYIFIKRKSS